MTTFGPIVDFSKDRNFNCRFLQKTGESVESQNKTKDDRRVTSWVSGGRDGYIGRWKKGLATVHFEPSTQWLLLKLSSSLSVWVKPLVFYLFNSWWYLICGSCESSGHSPDNEDFSRASSLMMLFSTGLAVADETIRVRPCTCLYGYSVKMVLSVLF